MRIRRPVAEIAGAGAEVGRTLRLGGPPWLGREGELTLALDQALDEMIDARHAGQPLREVDIEPIQRAALSQLLGADPGPAVARAVGVTVQRAWVAGVRPRPRVKTMLGRLRQLGLKLGLCSNAPYPPALMHEQLQRLGLASYFDAALFSSEVGWRKPARRIFDELLGRMRLRPEQVWFVGDDLECDMRGAAAAGIHVLLAPGAPAAAGVAERLPSWEALVRQAEGAVPGRR